MDNLLSTSDAETVKAQKKRNWKPLANRQKTPFVNLLRCKRPPAYFARLKVKGKLIRRRLKTNTLTVAKLRPAGFGKAERLKSHDVIGPQPGSSGELIHAEALPANCRPILPRGRRDWQLAVKPGRLPLRLTSPTTKLDSRCLLPRLVRRSFAGQLLLAVLVLGSAGTLKFWQGWTFLAVNLAATLGLCIYFYRHDPQLLERRLLAREQAGVKNSSCCC
jgi:hypothetical protein